MNDTYTGYGTVYDHIVKGLLNKNEHKSSLTDASGSGGNTDTSNLKYQNIFRDGYTFTPLSIGANLWSVWNNYRVANKNYKLERDKFNYTKSQNEAEKQRRAQMQNNFNTGFGGAK